MERAIYRADVRRVIYALDRGGNVNEPSETFGTALHAAAHLPYLDIVRLLVERGADLHALDRHGRTATQAAADWGQHEVAAYLNNCRPTEPTPHDASHNAQ